MASDSISDFLGPLLIGALVMNIAYGVTLLQTYFYSTRYPRDRPWLKLLVILIWTLETLHVVFVCHAAHHYLVIQWGNPTALVDGVWSLYASMTVAVLIIFIVQSFFTKHIYGLCGRLTRLWLIPMISFTVIAHLVLGIKACAEMFLKKQLSSLSGLMWTSAMPFAIMVVVSDFLVAGSLCVLLHNSRTSFRGTNTLINYLIIFAVNRCLLTSFTATVDAVMYAVRPASFWFIGINFVVGKLYANSLLATLNSRQAFRGRGTDVYTTELELNSVHVSRLEGTDETTGGYSQAISGEALGLKKGGPSGSIAPVLNVSITREVTYPEDKTDDNVDRAIMV